MRREIGVEWVPVRTAAKMLGVSMARVYQLIESGDLRAQKMDSTMLVYQKSVEYRQMKLPVHEDAAA